jgi:hypothetical protein
LKSLGREARSEPLTPRLKRDVEAVEKVPKQILGRDAEKSDLIECATINDLMPRMGQVTPENHPLIVVRGFFYMLIGLKMFGIDIFQILSYIVLHENSNVNNQIG